MTKRPTKPAAAKSEQPSQPKQAPIPAPAKSQPSQPSATKSTLATKPKPARKTANAGTASKQDRVVAMLERKEGATVAAVMKATGWQKHSVHGFFAGVVRKKLGLNLVSEQKGDTRVYRIVEGKRAKAFPSSRKQAA